jgi:hypothetical protein
LISPKGKRHLLVSFLFSGAESGSRFAGTIEKDGILAGKAFQLRWHNWQDEILAGKAFQLRWHN